MNRDDKDGHFAPNISYRISGAGGITNDDRCRMRPCRREHLCGGHELVLVPATSNPLLPNCDSM